MSKLDSVITIRTGEYRPCYVYGRRGLFHKWLDKVGIVEFEDGSVEEVKPTKITFFDSEQFFDEITWDDVRPIIKVCKSVFMSSSATMDTILKRPMFAKLSDDVKRELLKWAGEDDYAVFDDKKE